MKTLPTPLSFGWKMKGLDSAGTSIKKSSGGRLELHIQHDLIKGVSPQMLKLWFLTIAGEMEYAGITAPKYRIWHPLDHIEYRDVTLSEQSDAGKGSKRLICEAFGRNPAYLVDGVENVDLLDETGIRLSRSFAGVEYFSLQHWFYKDSSGTRYKSKMIVGTDRPVWRGVVNNITSRIFSEEMGNAWLRHNIEEVGNFEYFLPAYSANYLAGQSFQRIHSQRHT